MLSKEKIARINELAKKAKSTGLTPAEAKEQSKSMSDTIEHLKIIDPEGNDVTPDRVKKIQEEKKRLH